MAPNPIPPNVVPDQNRAPLVQPSRLWERVWFDWFLGIWKAVKVSVVAGPTGSIQYNDAGVQAGDANLTWDKTKQQQVITGATADSTLLIRVSGQSTLDLGAGEGGLSIGTHVTANVEIAEQANFGYFALDPSGSGEVKMGLSINETPGSPTTYADFTEWDVTPQTGTLTGDPAAGAIPGMAIGAARNDSGTGAASTIFGQLKDGRFFVFWVDNTGAPRWNVGATLASIRPTESGSVGDTSGNLFGSGGGTVTNTYTQLFTRRGEEGRSGTPGLPGPPGATGSTGATGPAGADGIIISRRADEGRAGIPGINGAAGVAGATGPAGQSAPVISRRGDDGRMGNPGPTGPTGATAATTRAITFAIDGGGSVLTTGIKAEQTIPYGCTITANTVLADQSGSVALDIKKSSFAGFPGSLASIVASAPPTLSGAQKSTDSTLTSWTTTITAGDVLQWSVSSVTTVTRVNCTLTVTA